MLTEIILLLPFFRHALPFLHLCLFLLNIFISYLLDFKLKCQFWLQGTLHPALAEYPGWLTQVMVTGFIFVASVGQLSLISNIVIIFSDDNQIIMINRDYQDT